jgi:hypothetical protein
MMKHLIGLVGFIGSGKGTVGDHLVSSHGYQSASFASSLKDAVSAIFSWPRHLLEGDTVESREWREIPDQYWSNKLQKQVTPRWVLQYLGTDVLRNNFNENIWINSLEKRLTDGADKPTVITDVRFPNEIDMITRLGGEIWWVKREPGPVWEYTAIKNKKLMKTVYPDVHPSEYEWIGVTDVKILLNDGTLDDLRAKIDHHLSQ